MDLLRTRGLLRAACGTASIVAAGAGCNALVGVDFGSAHLGDPDSGETKTGADATSDGHASRDGGRSDARDAMTKGDDDGDATRPGIDAIAEAGQDAGDAFVCDPDASPMAEACVLSQALGVFVSTAGSDSTGDGTMTHPYASVGAGIARAHGKRVYVCEGTYAEAIEVTASADGVSVYGGLSCPGDGGTVWAYTGQPTTVAPEGPGAPLTITGLTIGAHFTNLAFVAAAAAPAMGNSSTSSIAVSVSTSTNISFTSVTITSGAGAPGSSGGTLVPNGCGSVAGVSNTVTTPGVGPTCTCQVEGTGSSKGGNGKPARATTSTPAESGSADPAPTPPKGLGTPGSYVFDCTAGIAGQAGNSGTGGSSGAVGTLGATGWSVLVAAAGAAGTPGQGGGGGGGADYGGASGGAGGCGGNGGPGGGGGGASIGVAIWQSAVTFASVTLQSAAGGLGGVGAEGQGGLSGGAAGAPIPSSPVYSCAGGVGAIGGGGGGGGGGAGGSSIGIAFSGTPPVIDGVAASTGPLTGPSTYAGPMSGASGGAGGLGGAATGGNAGAVGTNGTTGIVSAVVSF